MAGPKTVMSLQLLRRHIPKSELLRDCQGRVNNLNRQRISSWNRIFAACILSEEFQEEKNIKIKKMNKIKAEDAGAGNKGVYTLTKLFPC